MSTKWTENCDPATPAHEFARSVLSERTNVMESLLPLAAHHHRDDTEHVHQLRVSSRRSAAALRAFTPLMSKKPHKLKDWLKRIRAAAGPARDIDVLMDRFAQESSPGAVTHYAAERLALERNEAQLALVEVSKQAIKGKLDRVVERTLRLLSKQRDPRTLGDFGMNAVRLAYTPFARLMHAQESTIEELHELRIAGKRLRYSLEIFHGLFPAELREKIYPLVEDIQGRLGEINDHATAQALFQSWLGAMPADDLAAQIAQRVVTEREDSERMSRAFLRWWNPTRIAKVEAFFNECCPSSE